MNSTQASERKLKKILQHWRKPVKLRKLSNVDEKLKNMGKKLSKEMGLLNEYIGEMVDSDIKKCI